MLLQNRNVGAFLSGLVRVNSRRLPSPLKLDSNADRGSEKLTGHAAYLVSISTQTCDSGLTWTIDVVWPLTRQ